LIPIYATIPASRAVALPDKLNSRSNTGRAEVAAGTFTALIITSYVLPAAINTSLCTRGTPGRWLPSSAISEKPLVALPSAVCDPTIEGTCMRKPAFTKRTKTLPVTAVAGKVGNSEFAAMFLLKPTPLIR
jgi:hypothetical protein